MKKLSPYSSVVDTITGKITPLPKPYLEVGVRLLRNEIPTIGEIDVRTIWEKNYNENPGYWFKTNKFQRFCEPATLHEWYWVKIEGKDLEKLLKTYKSKPCPKTK